MMENKQKIIHKPKLLPVKLIVIVSRLNNIYKYVKEN